MKNILITGIAGCIGSNLAKLLQENSHHIIGIDDMSSGYDKNLETSKVFKFYRGSITDVPLLQNIFAENKIDIIFHLAAFFANQNSVDHPASDLTTNGLGTLHLLELALKHNIAKFVYTSSSCVYGAVQEMYEDTPLPVGNLDTPYAISKLLGEQYCRFYAKHHKLDVAIARLFNAYGPGELPGQYRNVVPNFFKKAINKEALVITGNGTETRDFTYVGDIVQGLYNMAFSITKPGDVFNLGSGKPTEIITLAKMINKIASNETPIEFVNPRSWDCVKHRVANIEKAKEILKYNPQAELRESLEKTHQWILANIKSQ